MASPGHLEIEKLTELGKGIGLSGQELLDFVKEERAVLKEQRDAERAAQAEERAAQAEEREAKERENERDRRHAKEMLEMKLALEREKAEMEKQSLELHSKTKQEEAHIQTSESEKVLEMQNALLAKQLELENKRLMIEEMKKENDTNGGETQTKSKPFGKVPKLPAFNEGKDNIDVYLLRFERYAGQQKWPKSEWAVYLSALLTGKGLEVYYSLANEQANDYETLKKAILNRYEFNEEGFRKRFKNSKPEQGESGPAYANRVFNYFERWVDLSTSENTHEGIVELIVRDQFLHSIPKDIATFIRERKPKDIDAMTHLADQYIEAHGGWSGGSYSYKKNNKTFTGSKPNNQNADTNSSKQNASVTTSSDQSRKKGTCFICNRPGHHARDCRSRFHANRASALCETRDGERKLEAFLSSMLDNSSGEVKSSSVKSDCSDKVAFMMVSTGQPEVVPKQGVFKLDCGHELTVITAACKPSNESKLHVVDGYVGSSKVKALRDTGCNGVVVRESLVKPEQKTGEFKTCILIDGTVRKFPTAEVQIDTPYWTGKVTAKCMKNPVYDLILGQLEGMRDASDPNPNWREMRNEEKDSDVKEIQSHVANQQVAEQEMIGAVETRSQAKAKMKPFKPLIVPQADEEIVTAELLKQKQGEDPTLHKIREAVEANQVKQCRGNGGGTYSFVKDKGILYREFTAPNINYGEKMKQVVVPQDYRKQVMKVAHETILGGHQAAKRTHDRISTNFYWPGMGADIRRYCQSCDICQRNISKGRVTKVPLGETPIIDTPFERVAVDLIGPMKPTTDRGHRYILVLIDYATRYPEAIPLKSIEAEVVAEELMVMFTRLGIPKQILTDQGTQFMSNIMKELNRLLSIKPLVTTPYHAMCNGAVERFNGVLKSSLKKMCEERPRDWDRYICPLLFAYRDTPHTSTGFTPFELIYGRNVRGPMTILSELWTEQCDEGETKSTYQYIIDLQERLETTCQLAREEMQRSKDKYQMHYNKKTRPRSYQEGDEVLLLLPTDSNKLLMHWKGPFKIVKKCNRMNYQIDLGHRKQTFHINLLKKYHRRDEEEKDKLCSLDLVEIQDNLGVFDIAAVAVIEEEVDDEAKFDQHFVVTNEELLHLPPLESKETYKDVNISKERNTSQTQEANTICGDFQDVLTDIPNTTNLGEHSMQLTDDIPVYEKPYPIPHALKDAVKKEIDNMLDLGIIRPSNSPYASPLTIVAKPDGTPRICCDTRKINAKTLFDPQPIPDQEEIFAQLSKDNYFTKIDLSKGYWQVPMEEQSKKYTAFVLPGHNGGHYEFNVMPFGLVNSAATFSKIMRKLLHGMENVHNYIDDILIHTETWEKHLEVLKEVLKRLREARLTARPTKCHIGCSEVEFLGHVVGKGIIKPKPDKVEAIKEAARPETKTQLRSFLGLTGYYRKFIPNFASVAIPLTDKTRKGEPNKIQWQQSQEQAFKTLKKRVTSAPILHLPDLSKTFILRSDASERGLGAVLLQEENGEKFPIAYASKKLSKCQSRYSVMEKECLAIIWAVQRFEPFLYGREFIIETDHQPLACIKKSKVANGRIMRWALALQPYRYRLEVIKGSKNIGADYMSRIHR